MGNLLVFIKKLHKFAGYRLYANLIAMTIISSLEGIGILLLVPMLGLIGIFDERNEHAGFSFIQEVLDVFPASAHLAIVLGGFMALLAGQALLQRQQTLLNVRIQEGFVRRLRLDLHQAMLQASWAFYVKRRRSDFQHVLTSELGRVSMGTHLSLRLATSVIFTVIQIGLAFWLSPALTAFVLLSGALLLMVARRFIRRSRDQGRKTSELSQNYFAGITDELSGMKDIKSNMLEPVYIAWFRKLADEMEQNVVAMSRLQANSQALYKTASAVCIGGFILAAVTLFQVQAAQLMLILVIFSRLWPRFTIIQSSMEQIAVTLPAFRGLIELQRECEAAVEHRDASLSEPPLRVREAIECRGVDYRYDSSREQYALRDVAVRIPANRMTAVVGKSGAGKSTLIDLLMGLIRPEKGEVYIDGMPLTEGRLQALRRSIGYVPQDPFLFHASVRDNLLLVKPDASESELWEALRFSASEAFVRRLPHGLDTIVGDRGVRLSGGERQRLVLARAIMRKPSILVLDEATSALDAENDKLIQEAIIGLKGEMTILVIAHRLSTIRDADQVIVMEEGSVVQQGEVRQLSEEKRGAFGKLFRQQAELPL